METLEYLLFNVCQWENVELLKRYDFIQDRLRAIRQDMTIQRLSAVQCKQLLEPMIRFYVCCGYKLCESPIRDFDPVINKQFLLECLKQYLKYCDTMDDHDDIVNSISNIDINNRKQFAHDRPLMEAVYILYNLQDVHPLYRYLNLPRNIKACGIVRLAYNISMNNLLGNYVKVNSLALQLCPVTYCAFSVSLPSIQKRALQVMSHAYSSKQQLVPCRPVQHMLRFPSVEDLLEVAAHYGLRVEEDRIHFWKGNFKPDTPVLQPKLMNHLDTNHDLSWDNILQYKSLVS